MTSFEPGTHDRMFHIIFESHVHTDILKQALGDTDYFFKDAEEMTKY